MSDYIARLDYHWTPHAEGLAQGLTSGRDVKPWHRQRAHTLRQKLSRRIHTCGQRAAVVSCACGDLAVPIGCGLHRVCLACKRKRYGKMRRKMKHSMQVWRDDERGDLRSKRGGRERRWVMVTLSTAHTGDLKADRDTLEAGWKRLRAWVQLRTQSSHPFALVYEFTPGRDGLGHVHAHVAWFLPWIDWGEMAAAWRGHTDGKSSHLNFAGEKSADGCAIYLAKYMTKGVHELEPAQAAQWMAASYNRRDCRTSQGFYRPEAAHKCETCGWVYEFQGVEVLHLHVLRAQTKYPEQPP